MHSTQKNHICEECGAQLKSRQQLKKHMLIHIGDKKFKCAYCDKAFIMQKVLELLLWFKDILWDYGNLNLN